MSDEPVVYGAPYSVYVRAVRLTLTEKGVVDVFAPDGPPPEYLARHPKLGPRNCAPERLRLSAFLIATSIARWCGTST